MTLSRRQLLGGVGAAVSASVLGVAASTPASASDTDRVFVHPRDGIVGGLFDAIEAVGGTTVLRYDNFDFVVAEVPTDRLDDLANAAGIAFVEEDGETGIPSDWSPSLLDFLLPPDDDDCSAHPDHGPSWGVERIGDDDVDLDGTGVDVGILDTGIQSDHCSVSVAGGRNFTASGPPDDYEDRHGHGTHVAGIAGAPADGVGVEGVAPAANLYAVKVLDDDGSGRYSELVAGIDWCMEHDVELISMSLGGDESSTTVDEAIGAAHAAGHLLLTAAGNEGNDGDGSCDEETMTYPATHERVVAVTAMTEDDRLASFSSVGSAVDLLAPGTNVTSAYAGNEYAEASGTSVACPYVTGVAALVWERSDEEGPGPNEAVRETLAETAEPVLESCAEGDGLVNARAAVDDDHEPVEDGNGTDGAGGTAGSRVKAALEWVVNAIASLVEWVLGLFR